MLSLYDDTPASFSPDFAEKACFGGVTREDLALLEDPSGINLAKIAAKYSSGVILGSENIDPQITDYCSSLGLKTLPFSREALENGNYIGEYCSFYDEI